MIIYKITWFNENGWGRQNIEQVKYVEASSSHEVRVKLGLPNVDAPEGFASYNDFDKEKGALFCIEKIMVEKLI